MPRYSPKLFCRLAIIQIQLRYITNITIVQTAHDLVDRLQWL